MTDPKQREPESGGPKAGRLAGRAAIVTGASRGLGRAIAEAFLANGAAVLAVARNAPSPPPAGGAAKRWHGIACDIADPQTAETLAAVAAERLGHIDILVNNAGVIGSADAALVDEAEWDRIFAINLKSVFFVTRAVAGAMRAQGARGSIINVTSIAGQTGGLVAGPAYAASKAGLIGLTRAMARQLAPDIRVNALAPSTLDTDMTLVWPDTVRTRVTATIPLGRFGAAAEIVGAAMFLASDDASYVTGHTLNVNGGAYMG